MSLDRATGSSTPSSGSEFNLADPAGSFVSTLQRVVTVPASFFGALQRRGDFVSPLAFAVICFVISGVLGGILGLAFDRGIGGLLSSIILGPILLTIFLFVWAAILHALVLVFVKPSNSGFEATFRTAAYTFPLSSLVSWIPFVGGFVGLLVSLYAVYLNIVGIREMHSTTMSSAALVVLIPVVVLTILIACLAVTVGLALLAALGGGS